MVLGGANHQVKLEDKKKRVRRAADCFVESNFRSSPNRASMAHQRGGRENLKLPLPKNSKTRFSRTRLRLDRSRVVQEGLKVRRVTSQKNLKTEVADGGVATGASAGRVEQKGWEGGLNGAVLERKGSRPTERGWGSKRTAENDGDVSNYQLERTMKKRVGEGGRAKK